jgi:hypothetical protein
MCNFQQHRGPTRTGTLQGPIGSPVTSARVAGGWRPAGPVKAEVVDARVQTIQGMPAAHRVRL